MLILKQTFVGVGMHALMNVATNMIKNWKGERITKSSTHMIAYCKLTDTHPDLYRLFEVYVDKKKTKTKTVLSGKYQMVCKIR